MMAARSGVVKGYPDGTFRPGEKVTRAEGLAMIARFGGVKETTFNEEFSDINTRHWAATVIAGAYAEGMLVFLKGQKFDPNRFLTRAEAVEILYRSKPVSTLVDNLLDFDK